MKLLLTSNGLSNDSITQALTELVGKSIPETKIVFIPTAMNVGSGDKDWFIDDLNNIKKRGYTSTDIVDISALPKEIWLPRIEKGDVLFFGGGNTYHLMRWLKESGLAELLPKLLRTRVYAGISAGSIVTNPSLAVSSRDKRIYYDEMFGYNSEDSLQFVNFYTRPHFNSSDFPNARKEYLEKIATEVQKQIYAIDDMSAVKVDGDTIEVITEGEYLIL